MRQASKVFLFLMFWLLQAGTAAYGQETEKGTQTNESQEEVTQQTEEEVDPEEKPPEKEKFSQAQKSALDSVIQSTREANKEIAVEHQTTFKQSRLVYAIRERLSEAKAVMSRGLDSVRINEEYKEINEWHDIADNGFADSIRHRLSLANLSISKVIFHEIKLQSQQRVEVLADRREELENTLISLDSLINEDALFEAPKSEEDETTYYANTFILITEANKIQEEGSKTISRLNELIAILGVAIYSSENKLNIIEDLQKSIWGKNNIVGPVKDREPVTHTFGSAFKLSAAKLKLAIEIFFKSHPNIAVFFVIILISLFLYIRMLNRNYHQNLGEGEDSIDFYFLTKPLLCSAFLSLIVIQFFYLRLPFVLYGLAWLLCVPLFYLLVSKRLKMFTKKWLLALSVVFLLVYLDNLILVAYKGETIIMVCLAMAIIILAFLGITKISTFEILRVRRVKTIFYVSIFTQMVTFYALMASNHNLSKRMMVAGVFVIVVLVGIMYFVRFIHQIYVLSLEVYKKSDEEKFSLDMERLQRRLPKNFIIIGLILGSFIFLNTFYFFQTQFRPFLNFFTIERQLGDFSFTFGSILLFFGIIYVSFLFSKIVSYLLGESYIIQERLQKSRHKNLSNSLLLFRIGIVTIGVLLAFASTGIPLDRLTLIISALGVGIGFGLQTLVNNLVSGLIIAFEKPINVGDVIDIAGKMGTMKSIGVRSSKMTTWDGSDVVVPNGDLLNQHLVNWTLSDSKARFEVAVGVAYGSDLEAVNDDLMQMLRQNKEVMNYPRPLVLFQQFGDSSIDISIKFWVRNYMTGFKVKSDIIIDIDKLFKEKGYEIPFPQRDLYVKAFPEGQTPPSKPKPAQGDIKEADPSE